MNVIHSIEDNDSQIIHVSVNSNDRGATGEKGDSIVDVKITDTNRLETTLSNGQTIDGGAIPAIKTRRVFVANMDGVKRTYILPLNVESSQVSYILMNGVVYSDGYVLQSGEITLNYDDLPAGRLEIVLNDNSGSSGGNISINGKAGNINLKTINGVNLDGDGDIELATLDTFNNEVRDREKTDSELRDSLNNHAIRISNNESTINSHSDNLSSLNANISSVNNQMTVLNNDVHEVSENYVPKTRRINDKFLSHDMRLTADDVEALPITAGATHPILGELVVNGHIAAENATQNNHVVTKAQLDAKVAEVVNSAPETLNTLEELAKSLGDDPNFATTVANRIGAVDKKVDTEVSKLSTKVEANTEGLKSVTQKATINSTNISLLNSTVATDKLSSDIQFSKVAKEQSDQNSLISDILNAFSKESEKGTNLKFNSSATKVLGMTIYGNTEQVNTSGKNLFNPIFANAGQLNSTIKVSNNTITITKRGGNVNTIGFYNISPYGMYKFWSNLLKANTVTLSFEVKHDSGGPHILRYGLENAIVQSTQTTASWKKYTLTIPKNPNNNYVAFIFYSDGYASNTESNGFSIRNIQVEISDTATEFEPYTGGGYNLFDEFSGLPVNSIHGVTLSNQSGVLRLTGKPTVDWLPILVRDNLPLFDKNTYTVVSYNGVSPQLFVQILAYKKDGSGFDILGSSSSKIFTFETDSTKYDRYTMKIQLGNKAAYPESVTLYNNFALFRGAFTDSNLPEYSPYSTGSASPRPQLPQVIGELSETNVQITNKNLLKLTQQNPLPNFKAIVEPDGSIIFGGEIYQWWGANITAGSAVLISSNQTYTLSIDKPLPYSMCLAIFGRNGRINVGEPIIGKGKTSITFTPSEDIVRCHLYLSINGTGWSQNTPMPETNIKVQLEKGDTATTYVKHESSEFTIPSGFNLYKLTDDIYDEVRLENGIAKMIKRVGKLELSGEEYFRTINTENPGQFYVYSNVFDTLMKNSTAGMCTHFDIISNTVLAGVKTNKTVLSVFSDNGNDLIRIMFSAPDALNLKITDINSFKNWLKAEKANGTPVTVYYEMKTPTEEQITDQAILTRLNKLMETRTYDGITNISVTGEGLTPEIKVKYMRKIGE